MKYYSSYHFIDLLGNDYSCDMLRLSFIFREDCVDKLVSYFCSSCRLDCVVYPVCLIDWKYKNLVKVNCGESSLVIGIGFNGALREDSLKGFCEFNPNKCMPHFSSDLDFLLSCSSECKVVRFDLAIDIHVPRSCVVLDKDSRIYSLKMRNRQDITEYLGVRNSGGFVKLYNKTIESNLDYSLTRLEITSECDFEKMCSHLPVINVVQDTGQLSFLNFSSLNDTDIVLVKLLLDIEPNKRLLYLSQLGRGKRQKIAPYLTQTSYVFEYDFDIIKNIILLLNCYKK